MLESIARPPQKPPMEPISKKERPLRSSSSVSPNASRRAPGAAPTRVPMKAPSQSESHTGGCPDQERLPQSFLPRHEMHRGVSEHPQSLAPSSQESMRTCYWCVANLGATSDTCGTSILLFRPAGSLRRVRRAWPDNSFWPKVDIGPGDLPGGSGRGGSPLPPTILTPAIPPP